MKTDIILAGVGGQGILSIAAAIGMAAMDEGLHVKQAEVHGMSQRGGAVQSHLRLSSELLSSDLIPLGKADMIVSVEPMEALRYLPFLSPEGWLISNSSPFINIPDYPAEELMIAEIKKIKNHIILNADQLARETGNIKASNMIILGAASLFIEIKESSFLKGIESLFMKKGEKIVSLNINAFKSGRSSAGQYLN